MDDSSSNVQIGWATRRRYAPMSLLLVLATQSALAETMPMETGESLKYQCQGFQRARSPQEFDEFNGPRCHGYVQGITDALNGRAFCLPPLSLPERVQTVQAYLFAHGDRLKDNAGKLVVEAFSENYPCKPAIQAQPNAAQTPTPGKSSRIRSSRH